MGWTSDVDGDVVSDKPGKENSLELRKLWMPSSAMWTLCGRHWASLWGVGESLSMTCPISSVIQGHLSSMCRLNLTVQTSRKLGENGGVN